MILRSTDPALAEDEKRIIHWFEENFGVDDTATLAQWVWERERASVPFVKALWHIAADMKQHEAQDPKAGRRFVQNLIDYARQPRHIREAEQELEAHMRPLVAKALRFTDSQASKDDAVADLRRQLREKIRLMWPDKHRATVDGALMLGLRAKGGKVFIDFTTIVKAMDEVDPLATNARVSHAVADA